MSRDELTSRLTPEVYDLVMRAINEGVYDWDVATGEVFYSTRVKQLLGGSDWTVRGWYERLHPDDLACYQAALVAHFKQVTDRLECEYRYRAPDGSWRWARQHGIALRDANGRAIRMVGSTGDITDLKRAQEALRASEERYTLATNAATEGIYDWDLEAGTLLLSDRAKAFFTLPEEALTPAAWNERIHPDDRVGYRSALLAYFTGATPGFDHEYRVSDGADYRWVSDRGIAVRNAAGRVTRLVGATSDTTQRKQQEIELRRARDQAEAATRAKSDFLSNMSHELRTPLNAIIGFAEALGEGLFGELNPKQAEYLNDIHDSGKHLLSLINDILDLSKIEAGRMELDVSQVDIAATLATALTLVRERATRHGIALGLDLAPSIGSIRADERKLKQILLNLLSNAVKFTPDGGTVSVSARRTGPGVEVAVRDSGVGIAPEDQQAVFEEFRQVGSNVAHMQEGTGLGLALTKRFVEMHGGTIRVDSEPGQGCTFTFGIASQP